MVIHTLYIFDRTATCIFHRDWKRSRHCSLPREEEYKLVFGMVHSLKSVCSKLFPGDRCASIGRDELLHVVRLQSTTVVSIVRDDQLQDALLGDADESQTNPPD